MIRQAADPDLSALVAGYLDTARMAHANFRTCDAVWNGHAWGHGDTSMMATYAQQAYDARVAALTADPEQTAAAWMQDTVPNAEMLAFFATYLASH